MKYRKLGKTQLEVSEVGFGSWAIGGQGYGATVDDESMAALETAWEHGVNFFDTADTYGDGHSEKLIARFLKSKPRDKVIVASKAGWDFYHEPVRKNFTPEHIRFACEQSLKRLEVDAIDVHQLHNPCLDEIAKGEAVGELDKLRKEGKIRFIGISVHREDEALAALKDPRVDTVQLIFNLIDQRMAENVFDKAKAANVGIIAREPLACGYLTGKYGPSHEFAKGDHRRRWHKDKLEIDTQKIEKLKSILATRRLSLVRAALEFVLDFDAVSTVIPGAKRREQVLENLLASEDPMLRIQESHQLRELYKKEEIFSKGLNPC
ncbi:MAG TPA: aldo/keto reductase [Verrucomicrobiae bacterium]|jgi:aryl-alcohol dehydrogenase-like predicted oxidoreductase|nr:aldo/keto reductase [Verrucomicrobiae bacterium]